jgi:Tfp pilus assembly protein PilF
MRRKHLFGLLLGLVLLSRFDALPAEGDDVTLNRRAAVALRDQAVLKPNKGDYRRAINNLDKALLSDPDYELAYQNRMTAKHKSGDNQGALEDYNELIRLDKALNPTLVQFVC